MVIKMAEITKRIVSKLFERCYTEMTTDTGRNFALGIYYITRTVIVVVGVLAGISAVPNYLP